MNPDPQTQVEVFRAAHPLQAHVVRSALQDAGIPAQVVGDYLTTGLGALPTGWPNAARVLVDDAHSEQARLFIADVQRRAALRIADEPDEDLDDNPAVEAPPDEPARD